MFCRYCGTPSETPVCPACAAAQGQVAQPEAPAVISEETQVLTPEMAQAIAAEPVQPVMPEPATVAQPEYTQPVYAQPEYTQPAAPEYTQPVYAQPEYTQPAAPEYTQPVYAQPEYAQPEPPKKKSKKGLWLSLVAVVAAVGVAAFAFWPTISHWFQSPEAYLQDVTKDSLSTYTDGLANAYGALVKGEPLNDDYNNVSTKLSLELNDGVAALLATALQSEGVNLSADKLKSISIAYDVTVEGDLIQLNANVGLGGSDVLGVTAALDMQNSVAYLSVPRLSPQALKLDLKAMFGIDLSKLNLLEVFVMGDTSAITSSSYDSYTYDSYSGAASTYGTNSVLSTLMTATEALPSEDDFRDMLDGYLTAALEQITQVEKVTETVYVGGHSEEQTVLVATIDQNTLVNMGKAMLQYAQTDDILKESLEAMDTALSASYGQSLNLYNALMAEIPGLITELDAMATTSSSLVSIQFKTYVDGDDVLGYQLSTQGVTLFAFNDVEEDGTHYFQMTAPVTGSSAALFSGSYTESGDTKTGEIVLPVEGMDFTLGFEYSDTSISLRFTPPAALLQELMGASASYLTDGITLVWTTAMDDASVELPENVVDASSESQLMTWAYSLVGNLPSVLSDLGIPEDIVSDLLGDLF